MLHLIDFMCHTRAFQCYQQAGQWTFTGKILSEMVPPPTPLALWPGWMSAFLRLSQSASKLFSSHFSSSWLSSDSMWGSSVFNTLLYSSVGRKVALGIMDPAWAPFRTHHRILHSFCLWAPSTHPRALVRNSLSAPWFCSSPGQPEQPGATSLAGKCQHSPERTVKNHQGHSEPSCWSQLYQARIHFSVCYGHFPHSWQLKPI